MQYWKQQDDGRFRRIDGALVKTDSKNPERPWTATGPDNRVLSVMILSKPSLRTWRSARQAMDAVDQQFPMTAAPNSPIHTPARAPNQHDAEMLLRDRLLVRARSLAQAFEWRRPSLISD